MSVKRVSVIMPVYNVVSFLEEALGSVLSQDYADIEIIVVNDGSDAGASKIITTLCAKDARIRLIEQSHKGQVSAQLAGLHAATGEYIMFLDGDDVMLPGAITHLAKTLDTHPTAIASYGPRKKINEEGRVINQLSWAEKYVIPDDILPALLAGWPMLSNGSICIKKQPVDKVKSDIAQLQGIERIEDWLTWCRLALLGDIIYAGSRTIVHVRSHAQNISRKAVDQPSTIFDPLKIVYEDPDIIARIGANNIPPLRRTRLFGIHMYLSRNYWRRRQYIRSIRHKALARWLALFGIVHPRRKIRIMHVVKWFYAGGAERLVSSLLQHSDSNQFRHMVLSLSNQNERLQDVRHTLGIPYKAIEISYGEYNIKNYIRCFLHIRRMKPDIIKTWLPPGNIAGGIIGRILRKPVIWGIHNAHPPSQHNMMQFYLSRYLPKYIVCCSRAAYEACLAVGYNEQLLVTITNGTDTERFTRSPEGREGLRKELGIDEGTLLIGMAAEGTPIKRHEYFIAAAKLFLQSHPNARFIFCGKYVDSENKRINDAIELHGMRNYFHLLGIRNDMANIYSALDIHSLTSENESFGLAITEAMSCKTLCVATNVGIVRDLLTDVGYIIEVSADAAPLAHAWEQCLQLSKHEKIQRLEIGRNRVIEHYSIVETAKNYDNLFRLVYGNDR